MPEAEDIPPQVPLSSFLAVSHAPPVSPGDLAVLAQQLGLDFLGAIEPKTCSEFACLLHRTEHGLGLQPTGKGAHGAVRAEFADGKAGFRREHGGGAGQMVARAVGLKKARRPLKIVDATAGLGQDAFVLATLGCELVLFERSPVINALLADGLARAAADERTALIAQRLSLKAGDAIQALAEGKAADADVIYLDPMFPHRDKSALVKKEMRLFREVVGADDDADGLLAAALGSGAARVVVKRPRKAPELNGPAPSTRIEGRSSRYDIYALRSLESGD